VRGLGAFLAVVLTLVVCAAAAAEPVQEFGFQIKDVTPAGHYGVVFSSNSYDTTGDQPPALISNSVRFAAGISFLPQFLRRSALCQTQKLRDTLRAFPEPKVQYGDQVKHLPATLKRLRPKLKPAQVKLLATCVAAREGTGRVTVDARPFFNDPIPADLYLFLSTPTVKGAFASFGVLVVPDRSSPVVRDSGLLQDQRFVVAANLFNDPSPDGVYGYRLLLPPGNIDGLRFSVAELRVDNPGMTRVEQTITCLQRGHGRCLRRKVTKKTLWWATRPTCPASGLLQFEATYAYETGLSTTKVLQVPCPRFQP
jgi:hypothetical protein